ncbi:MAG: Lon-like protease helical domain-containing protein, partial [Pseudomonadota bacterium]
MFFKKSNGSSDRTSDANGTQTREADGDAVLSAPRHTAIAAADLRRTVDASSLGFETTQSIEPAHDPIGQERAIKAIQFGADMPAHDFNVFVLGPPASGKTTAVRAYLASKTIDPKPIRDWLYVNNFEDPNRPKAVCMPCGRAPGFERAMVKAVDELRQTVPAVFEGDDYQGRRREIDEGFQAGQEQAFEALSQKAAAQNIAIMRTPNGLVMAPMHDGKVVKPEVFSTLPEDMRKSIQQKI